MVYDAALCVRGPGFDSPCCRRFLHIDCLRVTSHTLPHADSGSYQGPVTTPSPPFTRDQVAQAPTTENRAGLRLILPVASDIPPLLDAVKCIRGHQIGVEWSGTVWAPTWALSKLMWTHSGALMRGPQCHLSILRKGNVPCR